MMNQQERDVLAKKINFFLKLYGKVDFTTNMISSYMDTLDSFFNKSLNDYLYALDEYSKNKFNKTFPTPIQLRPYLDLELDDLSIANELAQKIKKLVSKKGYDWSSGRFYDHDQKIYEGKDANFWTFKEAVESECGPIGYEVIKKYGGWSLVCNDANENNNFIPQLRELIKSTLEFSKKNHKIENLELTSNQQKKISYQQFELNNYLKIKTINE